MVFNNFGYDHLAEAAGYKQRGLRGLVEAAAALGFEALQYCPGGRQDEHLAALRQTDVPALKQAVRQHGTRMSFHNHAFFPLPTLDHFLQRDAWYEQLHEFLSLAIDIMAEIGGDLVTFHPPQAQRERDLAGHGADAAERAGAIEAFGEMIRAVAPRAEKRGVRLGIEAICFPLQYSGGTAFKRVDELDAFLRAPDMPKNVGVLIDATHFHHKGEDVSAVIERFADRLWDIHVSDCIVHEWTDAATYCESLLDEVHWPVGSGTTDFAGMIRTLRRIGYSGRLTLELYPQHVTSVEALLASRDRLNDLLLAS